MHIYERNHKSKYKNNYPDFTCLIVHSSSTSCNIWATKAIGRLKFSE